MQIENVSEIAFFQWSISSYSGNKPQPKSVDETKFNEKKLEKRIPLQWNLFPTHCKPRDQQFFEDYSEPSLPSTSTKDLCWNLAPEIVSTLFFAHIFPSNYFWVKIFYRHLNCKRTNDLNESMGDKPPPFLWRTTSTADIGHFSMDKMSSREHYCCARRNPKTNAWTRLSPLILAQQRSCGGGVFFCLKILHLLCGMLLVEHAEQLFSFFYWACSVKSFYWDPTSK